MALESHAALARFAIRCLKPTRAMTDEPADTFRTDLGRGARSRRVKKAVGGQSRPSSRICTTAAWCG